MTTTAYDQLVDRSDQGTIFARSWWLDAVAPDSYELITVQNGGYLKAAWPIVYRKSGGETRIGMPDLTHRLGIMFAPQTGKYAERISQEQKLEAELLKKLPKGYAFDQFFHQAFTDWLPMYWEGFRQTTRYTYVLDDLSDPGLIWKGMRANGRATVRKAQRAGIMIRETDDLEYYNSINVKTFARQGIVPNYTLDLLARIDGAASKHAGRKALVAEDTAGRAHACEYIVYDSRCAISLLRGGDPSLRASGASALLQWESIRYASTVSKSFDFMGSMTPGVETYIREFGARQTPYFHIWRSAVVPRSSVRRFAGRALRRLARIADPSFAS